MKIIAFAGSTRTDSLNVRVLRVVAAAAAAKGAEVERLDLADYDMPLYNGDDEAEHGVPGAAVRLAEKLAAAEGLLIASPEYNGSITPLMKNTIDWITRTEGGLACFRGKIAVVVSASPGGMGGMRSVSHLNDILRNLGVLVLPRTRSVSRAHDVFDDEGRITDDKEAATLKRLGEDLVAFLGR